MTNDERIEAAEHALQDFQINHGTSGDLESDIVDLVADLMHYAASQGINPKNVLRIASDRYEEEKS